MFRTIRSRHRRVIPAVIGSGILVVAVFLLQEGSASKHAAAPQLAASQRTAEGQASRGAPRSADGTAQQIADASQNGAFGSPSDAPDATTTTVAPATTTTVAPTTTTTAKPAPPTTAKPAAAAPKTTAAPKPTSPPAPKPVATGSGSICQMSPGSWCSLAKCESGDKNVNTGNGYYGYFQFSASTWKAMGGSGLPSDNDAATQLAIAQKLQARSGWGQWPVCGRGLS